MKHSEIKAIKAKAVKMYPKEDFKQFKPDFIRQGLAPNATYLDWLKFERQFSEPEQHKVLDYKIKNPRGNI